MGANYGGSVCNCTRSKDERFMFIARGALGTPWIRYVATDQENPMRRPPPRPNLGNVLYDSVLGECKANDPQARLQFREMILYDRQQSYPEYILSFSYL